MTKNTAMVGRNMGSSAQHHDTAARWLVRRDSGQWSDADEAELQNWLSASTGHRVAYIRLNTAWRETNRVQVLGAGEESVARPQRPFKRKDLPAAMRPTRIWHWSALAAGVVAAVLTAVWFSPSPASSYQTPIGGLASIPMPDGSKATLNTDSEISVAMTKSERRIDLKRGEAFFEVTKDPARPFVVRIGGQRVTAVGTAFSVLRSSDGIRIVVTEGRVRVEEGGWWEDWPAEELSAGEMALVGPEGVRVLKAALLAPEEHLSWRSGLVIFRETPLAQAAAEMNRYNERKLVIGDKAVAGMRIGGTFRANNMEAFVRLLEKGFPISSESRSGRVVLLAKDD